MVYQPVDNPTPNENQFQRADILHFELIPTDPFWVFFYRGP